MLFQSRMDYVSFVCGQVFLLLALMTILGKRGDVGRLRQRELAAHFTKPVREAHLYDCLALMLGSVHRTMK
jgi:hypothetical protein